MGRHRRLWYLYVEALLNEGQERGVKITGAVDPDPRKCNYWIRGLHGWKAWQNALNECYAAGR